MSVPERLRARTGAWRRLVAASLLVACHDNSDGNGLAPSPSPQQAVQLRVEPAIPGDSMITVTVRVSTSAAVPTRSPRGTSRREATGLAASRVASLTASVFYDSTRLHFVQDVSPTDGALRAARAQHGRLQIAAAHALGFDGDAVARVTFRARDSAAYRTLRLQVSELHLLDASDARPHLTVLPVEVVR